MAGSSRNDEERTALLIRCSAKESKLIRAAAKMERRSISAYVLNCIMQRIAVREKTQHHFKQTFRKWLK
jgi:uncharacterized protein (DUF1778 family)